MNNSILVVTLGITLAICLAVTKIAGDAQYEYKKTDESLKKIEASIEAEKPQGKSFYSQYSVEKLKENYIPSTVIGDKKIINVPILNQYPELPTGCEITSATAILNYIGFNVDKVYMQENFLEQNSDFHLNSANERVGPDPGNYFVGNPKKNGFGCFSSVITDSLNKFFSENGSKNHAINLIDADQYALEDLLNNGVPIEVWASIDMKPFKYSEKNQWILENTGETFNWSSNSHTLVLIGYDEENYYFSDCNNENVVTSYKKKDFLARWEEYGRQAVIVKINR